MAKKIEVQILGDASSLEKAFRKGSTESQGFGKSMGGALKVGGIAAAAGIGIAAIATTKFIKAAMESQRVDAQTQAQLKALGISYKEHAGHINDVIQATSKLSGIDDEELQGSFNQIVRVTKNVNTALRDTSLAADIARGKNISLATATSVVQKAQMGMVSGLKRMGIEIPPVTAAVDALKASKTKYTTEEMAAAKAADLSATKQAAIAQLQKTFAGQAEAYGKTAAGAQERFGVAVENLEEKLGGALLPTFTKVVLAITDFVDRLTNSQRVQEVMAQVVAALTEAMHGLAVAVDFVRDHWTQISAVLEQIAAKFQQFASTVVAVVRGAVTVVTALWSAFGATLTQYVVSTFKNIQQALTGAFQIVEGLFRLIADVIHGRWGKAWDDVKEIVRGAINLVEGILGQAVNTIRTLAALIGRALWEGIKTGVEALAKLPGLLLNLIGAGINKVVVFAALTAIRIGEAIVNGVLGGLASLASRVQHALEHALTAAVSFAGKVLHGSGDYQWTKHAIGTPMAEGIIYGVNEGLVPLGVAVAQRLNMAATETVQYAMAAWDSAGHQLATVFNSGVSRGLGALEGIMQAAFTDALSDAWQKAWNAFQPALNKLRTFVNTEIRAGDLPAGVGVGNLPHFAGGGSVSRGGAYVVGEKGPELFVPSMGGRIVPNGGAQASAWAGGGDTYNFHFDNYVGDKSELVDMVRSSFARINTRKGGTPGKVF